MILQTKNVTKYFGKEDTLVKAVDGVDFGLSKGNFISITGKSGSGKSTFLYLLGLLDSPTNGEIFFDNSNVLETNRKQRRLIRLHKIGYVFQDYSLMPSLTALTNITVPLIMQGFSFNKSKEIARKSLNDVGLINKEHKYPSQLSGGEKQRVGIARAMAKNPLLLIADEPTANLDSKTSKDIINVFLNLNKQGQTIIMVTHELEYAKLANKQYKMKDGKFI